MLCCAQETVEILDYQATLPKDLRPSMVLRSLLMFTTEQLHQQNPVVQKIKIERVNSGPRFVFVFSSPLIPPVHVQFFIHLFCMDS